MKALKKALSFISKPKRVLVNKIKYKIFELEMLLEDTPMHSIEHDTLMARLAFYEIIYNKIR